MSGCLVPIIVLSAIGMDLLQFIASTALVIRPRDAARNSMSLLVFLLLAREQLDDRLFRLHARATSCTCSCG